jgi:hypothetical protein
LKKRKRKKNCVWHLKRCHVINVVDVVVLHHRLHRRRPHLVRHQNRIARRIEGKEDHAVSTQEEVSVIHRVAAVAVVTVIVTVIATLHQGSTIY